MEREEDSLCCRILNEAARLCRCNLQFYDPSTCSLFETEEQYELFLDAYVAAVGVVTKRDISTAMSLMCPENNPYFESNTYYAAEKLRKTPFEPPSSFTTFTPFIQVRSIAADGLRFLEVALQKMKDRSKGIVVEEF